MTCPKCRSHNAEPIERWTIFGRKLTIPLLRLWACVNRECRHHWPRELSSPIEGITSQESANSLQRGAILQGHACQPGETVVQGDHFRRAIVPAYTHK